MDSPPYSCLPLQLPTDRRESDDLLFRAGSADAVDGACWPSADGKSQPDKRYVRRTVLDPLLREYQGCAHAYLGEIDGANLIKLHRQSGNVSYLSYPDFDTDPHPGPRRSVKPSLHTRAIDCFDETASTNPPILDRKEALLVPDHPLHARFAR